MGWPTISQHLILHSFDSELFIAMVSRIPGYDDALNAAALSVPTTTALRLPWEASPIMKNIFSSGPDDIVQKRPRLSLVATGSDADSSSAMPSRPVETHREN